MRKLLYSLVLIVCTYTSAFASTMEPVTFATITSDTNITMTDIDTVVSYYVPEKYQNAFNFYTTYEDDETTSMNMKLQILALGCWESSEWTVTISPKNNNGSRDYGYLMLNSKNITDSWFMERFGYHEEDGFILTDETDALELYLICCIKLYRALYNRYGDDAAYCYNGGETRYIENRLPDSTYAYKRNVNRYVDKLIGQIEYERDERIRIEEERQTFMNDIQSGFCRFRRTIKRYNMFAVSIISGKYRLIVIKVPMECDDKRIKPVILKPLEINLEYKYEGQVIRYGHKRMDVFRSIETGELVYV